MAFWKATLTDKHEIETYLNTTQDMRNGIKASIKGKNDPVAVSLTARGIPSGDNPRTWSFGIINTNITGNTFPVTGLIAQVSYSPRTGLVQMSVNGLHPDHSQRILLYPDNSIVVG